MKKEKVLPALLLLLSVLLLVFSAGKAHTMSITHDEASSYLNYGNLDVFSCFFSNPDCWWMANNHMLNTFLFQITTSLFGVSEWSMRLPNLLGHVLYLYATAGIILMSRPGWLVGIAGFVILNANPYLLDFFSLARGYGLSVGLMTASLYALFLFFRGMAMRQLVAAYLLAFLSVMAVFTALLYFAAAVGITLLFLVWKWRREEITGRRAAMLMIPPVLTAAVLAVLLRFPILTLQAKGEFEYGVASLKVSFLQLVQNSLYGQNYFSRHTDDIFLLICALLLFASALAAAFRRRKPVWTNAALRHTATALLFAGIVLEMVVQHYLVGSEYLIGRKSILFIPLAGLLVYQLLMAIDGSLSRTWARVGAGILLVAGTYHFSRSATLEYCREWWYDENTRDVVEYIGEVTPEGETVRLGVNWLFCPAAEFYRVTRDLDYLEPLLYSKEIRTDIDFDYYYVDQSDLPLLEDGYEVVREYLWGRYLLVKSEVRLR